MLSNALPAVPNAPQTPKSGERIMVSALFVPEANSVNSARGTPSSDAAWVEIDTGLSPERPAQQQEIDLMPSITTADPFKGDANVILRILLQNGNGFRLGIQPHSHSKS